MKNTGVGAKLIKAIQAERQRPFATPPKAAPKVASKRGK
jgi:hypothetical protein